MTSFILIVSMCLIATQECRDYKSDKTYPTLEKCWEAGKKMIEQHKKELAEIGFIMPEQGLDCIFDRGSST